VIYRIDGKENYIAEKIKLTFNPEKKRKRALHMVHITVNYSKLFIIA